jgi:hypothetical protein
MTKLKGDLSLGKIAGYSGRKIWRFHQAQSDQMKYLFN